MLTDFERGDIDRPVIIGPLYNGDDVPLFAAGVDTDESDPGVISVLHATTLDGGGYNELVFDNATGQSAVRVGCRRYTSRRYRCRRS